MLDLEREVAGHGPVEGDGGEAGGVGGRNVECDAVIGLAGTVGVGERKGALAEREGGGEGELVHRNAGGVAEILGREHEEARVFAPALANEGDEILHGGDAVLGGVGCAAGLEAVGVETVEGLGQVEEAGVAGAGEQVLELVEDVAVVGEKIKGPSDDVVDQRFADKNLGGVGGINFAVGDGAVFEFEAVEAGALFDHDAAGVLVPERLAVGDFEEMAAEIEGPGWVEAGGGAGVEARSLHDLGGHEGRRPFFLARVCAARRGDVFLFRFVADMEGGAGEEGDAAVVAGFVAAVFVVAQGDVAQEAGEDAAVDGAVAGGAGGEEIGSWSAGF